MIAPRPEVVSRELFRVVRPGNTVGMTAWTPESKSNEMFEIGRRYAPQDLERPRLEQWGTEAVVQERFGDLANSIEMERRTLPWAAESPEAWVDFMERSAPTQAAAKEHMPPEQYESMRGEMAALAREWAGGDGPFEVEVEYLLIVARRRG
jgi:hypothetical protein